MLLWNISEPQILDEIAKLMGKAPFHRNLPIIIIKC